MKKLALILPLTVFLLIGCSNDLGFVIEYDNADGLKKGDSLVYAGNVIGEVGDIQYTDSGKIQVSVKVLEEYRDLAKRSSLFFVNASEDTASKVVELVASSSETDRAIEDGEVVRGSDKMKGLVQDLSNQFGQALQSLTNSVQAGWQEWKDKTLDQQISALETELDKILDRAKNVNESTRKYLKEEVVPQINQQIEELRSRLEDLNRQDELDSIEKKLDKVDGYLQA